MIEKGMLDENSGFKYTKDNEVLYEYHVDDHADFQKECSMLPFGGSLSVRKPHDVKPLVMFGQDEVIFCQYLMWLKSWTLPDGTRQLILKDDGIGLMLSSFCSMEFGYGMQLIQADLDLVNEKRKDQCYSDLNAAKIKYGTDIKPILTVTPFVCELEYGKTTMVTGRMTLWPSSWKTVWMYLSVSTPSLTICSYLTTATAMIVSSLKD